jgi:hypothetical protein
VATNQFAASDSAAFSAADIVIEGKNRNGQIADRKRLHGGLQSAQRCADVVGN